MADEAGRILDPLRRLTDVRWSAAVLLDNEEEFADALGADEVLPTASVGKLLLLITVLELVQLGRLDRAELLTATNADQVADSGLWQQLDQRDLAVVDLCRLVGAVSDNLATNVLIRRVGLERVTEVTTRVGLRRCGLHDMVRDVRCRKDPPHLSTGAAGELVDLIRRLQAGAAISAAVSAAVVELLRLNTDLSMVAGALALDPLAHTGVDLGVRLFNKTGTQLGTRADVGCVEIDGGAERRTACYAVIARFEDSRPTRAAVLDAMSEVGRRLFAA